MASANSKARRRLFRGILPAAAVAVPPLGGAAQAAPASHVASSQHAAFAGSFFDATRGLTSASACCDDSGSGDDSGSAPSPAGPGGDTPTSDPTDFGDGSTSDTGSDMGSDTSTDPGADTG